jgi:NhaP-type Na+/H+ or K+/H+ antiporter
VRPLSVWLGLRGTMVSRDQRLMMSWFGIRGIGLIYYLMFALSHGLSGRAADQVLSVTLTTIAVAIVVHGVSVTPLMSLYVGRRARRAHRPDDRR